MSAASSDIYTWDIETGHQLQVYSHPHLVGFYLQEILMRTVGLILITVNKMGFGILC